eukprot:SAG31_NODE_5462_length_2523_cov_2.836634_3_plen_43_part_00
MCKKSPKSSGGPKKKKKTDTHEASAGFGVPVEEVTLDDDKDL